MSNWNPGKQDANYSFQERTFDGAAAMWLRKSQEEAPSVGVYNYADVNQVEAYGSEVTDMNDFNSQWSTTLYGEKIASKDRNSETAAVQVDTILNDTWFSVMIGDVGRIESLLERARMMGVQFPADYPMKNMFGESSLWSRINDSEFKIDGATRDRSRLVLQRYHQG